jgi:hypothetical protein
MNRTSKRISEYPFQPLRRNSGRFLSLNAAAERFANPRRRYNTLAGRGF